MASVDGVRESVGFVYGRVSWAVPAQTVDGQAVPPANHYWSVADSTGK